MTAPGTTADPQILLPVGDQTTNLNANQRREDNIMFVRFRVKIDVSTMTKDPSHKFSTDTFIQLPLGDKSVKNGNGNDVNVHTLLGRDDLRTYDAADFKSEALNVTNQKKPGELHPPGFGMTDAYLDHSKK